MPLGGLNPRTNSHLFYWQPNIRIGQVHIKADGDLRPSPRPKGIPGEERAVRLVSTNILSDNGEDA